MRACVRVFVRVYGTFEGHADSVAPLQPAVRATEAPVWVWMTIALAAVVRGRRPTHHPSEESLQSGRVEIRGLANEMAFAQIYTSIEICMHLQMLRVAEI